MDLNKSSNDNNTNNSYSKTNETDFTEFMPEDQNKLIKSASNKKTAALAGTGGVLLLLWKFKAILLLILGKFKFLFIFLKLGKLAATFGSMFLMIVVETQRYGLPIAIGFVLLLLIHEMGHYLTAKKCGLNVSAPIFIPFLGAFISMKEMPKNVEVEVKVSFGGPVLGSIGALACLGIYSMTGSKSMLFLAYVGLMINLFNLIPINPLDGGRIVSGLSPKVWIFGIVFMIFAAIYFKSPLMILILILGIFQTISYWRNPDKSYYELDARKRMIIGAAYFGLVIFLGASIFEIYQAYDFSR
jgi:Zn-dependent protease